MLPNRATSRSIQALSLTARRGSNHQIRRRSEQKINMQSFFQRQGQKPAKSLSECYAQWLKLCQPLHSWRDNILSRGLSLQSKGGSPPPYLGMTETVLSNPGQCQALQNEIAELLLRGAISLCTVCRILLEPTVFRIFYAA